MSLSSLPELKTEIRVSTDKMTSDLDRAGTTATGKADAISAKMSNSAEKTIGQSMTRMGDSMQRTGERMTAMITLPIVGAATATSLMAKNYSKDLGNVATLFDGTAAEVRAKTDAISADIKRLSSDTGISLSEMADGAYNVVSAFGDTEKVPAQLEAVSKAAVAGNASTVDSLELLSAVTKGYGDTSAEALSKTSDLAFQTVKLGQTTFPELAASIGKVVPLANAMAISQEELFGVMATATGVTGGAAEVSTQFRGVLQSLMSPTADMTGLLEELGFANGQAMVETMGFQGALDTIVAKADEAGVPLQKYISSIEGQTLALALTGEQHDVLTEKIGAMEGALGSTEEAFRRVTEGEGFEFDRQLQELKNSAVSLGEKVLPLVNDAIGVVTDLVGAFTGLPEPMQSGILKFVGLSAAAGPFLKIGGGLLSTLPKVAGAFGLLGSGAAAATGTAAAVGGTGVAGLAAGLGGVVAAAAPVALAIGAVGLAGYGLYKTLSQDVVPEVDLFADSVTLAGDSVSASMGGMSHGVATDVVKISDATKEALGAYIELDRGVEQALYGLKITHGEVTSEIATDVVTKTQQMGQQVLDANDANFNDQRTQLQAFFDGRSGLTEAEQLDILTRLSEHHLEEQTAVQGSMDRIKEIMETAKEEKRALTEEEQVEIAGLQDLMREHALTTLSATEEEANIIRERLKASQERITAEMASELLQKAIQSKDDEIAQAEEKYDELVRQAGRLRDAGVITEEEYRKMVEAADKTRREQIDKAEAAVDGIRGAIEESSPGIWSAVSAQTGQMISIWQQAKNVIASIFSSIQSFASRAYKPGSQYYYDRGGGSSHYNGLDHVPYDGYQAVLHRGERVLTAEENERYTSPGMGVVVNLKDFTIVDRRDIRKVAKEFGREMQREVILG